MKVRWDSTSGGAFTALADAMYRQGGYVSGAIYNDDFSVRNYISNNPDDLVKIRSSKYLQSKAEGVYAKYAHCLEKEKKFWLAAHPAKWPHCAHFLERTTKTLL